MEGTHSGKIRARVFSFFFFVLVPLYVVSLISQSFSLHAACLTFLVVFSSLAKKFHSNGLLFSCNSSLAVEGAPVTMSHS